jgi:predicted ABC-type exoprotein transport system permease subunit
MKKGERAYFTQFGIFAAFVAAVVLLAYFQALPAWAMQVLVVGLFLYMLLFAVGLFFNAGPFKYIGKLYAKDAEQERNGLKPKQPWE